jgi:hypothetical protein
MNPDPQKMLPVGSAAPVASRIGKHEIIFAVLGFLCGIVVAALWFTTHGAEPAQKAAPVATSTSQTNSENAVVVHDQAAGGHVVVDSVNVPPPGVWVAVAEMRGGTVMNVLGVGHVFGPATDVSVRLLRDTIPAQSYAIVLYRDDGDGQFDLHKDSVYVDWNTGERVVALFKTTL